MDPGWKFNEADRQLAAEIEDFLPERVFDAHAHLTPWRLVDLPPDAGFRALVPSEATFEVWREHLTEFCPRSSLVGGLFMPYCPATDRDRLRRLDIANDFLVGELAKHPNSRGHLFIAPEYPVDKVAE